MPARTSAKETGAAGRLEILTKNNCLPDRVYRAGTDGPLVLGGFLPVPVALAAEAERLASLVSGGAGAEDLGSAALVAVADLDRVQCLNVIGWLQPEIGPDNRLRVTDGAPTHLWDKWTEILRWAEGRSQGAG